MLGNTGPADSSVNVRGWYLVQVINFAQVRGKMYSSVKTTNASPALREVKMNCTATFLSSLGPLYYTEPSPVP